MTMISSDEKRCDEDIDIAKAREILSWRPGFRPRSLPSKGGPKFFGYTGASLEAHKVDEQLKQYDKLLCSLKVRKASKLGRAEWMQEYGLAKVTKQGKFIQTTGHHNGEYFALFAEEALFLLDTGDIELTLNDIPISLQEAFSLVFNNSNCKCNFDDYVTFSNLVKRGYIVRRHGIASTKCKHKRHRRSTGEFQSTSLKHARLDDSNGKISQTVSGERHSVGKSDTPFHCNSREWFRTNDKHEMTASSLPTGPPVQFDIANTAVFPNLANTSHKTFPAPSTDLLPEGIPSCSYSINDIWFQRIKRDDTTKQVPLLLRNKTENRPQTSRKCQNWSEYKALRLEAKAAADAQSQQLQDRVSSWDVKPLVLPGTCSVTEGLRKVQGIARVSESERGRSKTTDFDLRYDVYESGSSPFKKTNPGQPHFIVAVTNVQNSPPTSLDIISLLERSDRLPIKFAVVDDGQVSFYEFEASNIPVI